MKPTMEDFESDCEDVVKSLCFSRLPGSENAVVAEKLIEDKFSEAGIKLTRQPFKTTTFLITTVLQGAVVLAILITAAMIFLSYFKPIANLIISIIVIVVAVVVANTAGGGSKPIKIGKLIDTCNYVYEQMPPGTEGADAAKKTIIFAAHHDTKGQPLTTIWRSSLFTFGGLALIVMLLSFTAQAIADIFSLQFPKMVHIIGVVCAGIVIVCCIPLAFNGLVETSPGALDNASGVAAVYCLAKYFKNKPLKSTRIIYLITGAEELGMLGAREYLFNSGVELDKENTFMINFDMIAHKGSNVEIMEKEGLINPKIPSKYLVSVADKAASMSGTKLDKFTLPIGGATDRGVFTKAGYHGIDLINKKAAVITHSPKDCFECFDPSLASKFINLSIDMARIIDES